MYMNIPNSVYAKFKDISRNTDNSNRILTAMINAIKSTMKKIRSRCTIDFLRNLKKHDIGTNEVEHNVRRTCKMLNEGERKRLKKRIMRCKINDTYREYKKIERENYETWRREKKKIPPPERNIYILNTGKNMSKNIK